jgi:methyltransferase-like protein
MSDEEQGIWNGGNTRINEKKELEILRGQEDYYDITDSERETREELVKRQEIMDKTRIETKPLHELYKGINKQINNFEKWKDERTPWSNMAGPKRDKS